MSRAVAVLVLCALTGRATVWAQVAPEPTTRAEALDAARREREKTVRSTPRPWLERALFYVEDKRVFARLNPPTGFYPAVGGVTPGSGFGVGLGYRQRSAGGRLSFDTSATRTFRAYQALTAQLVARPVANWPASVALGGTWFDYTQEDFFGLGRHTNNSDRVSFGLTGFDTHTQAEARAPGRLVLRARAGVQRFTVGGGTDTRFASLEERFSDLAAPGMGAPLTLTYINASVGRDSRDQARNTRAGGRYNVTVAAFRDRRGDEFNFNRVDLTAMHVIPIFDKKRGIALHAMASRSDPAGDSRVPFYLMPTVGGPSSLRGLNDFRLRDAAAVTLNAEYRWEAFSGLDLALFVDAGDVGPTWRSIIGSKLRTSWGGGFRFNTNRRVFMRVDIAGGREGTRVWATARPLFSRE